MKGIIGIDLGTTMSAVARLGADGKPEIVFNENGENITPSAVAVEGADPSDWLVGTEAKRMLWDEESSALGRFKRDMGSERTHQVAGHSVTPTELSAAVLGKLKAIAERSGPIGSAVVTVPANFGNDARVATSEAAEAAGLPVEFIINEPTAAALYFASTRSQSEAGTVAVFDLGGGTFDVSVVRLDGQDVSVLSTTGVERLGGMDFDAALQELVQRLYQEKTGGECSPEDYDLNQAEEDKKSLSTVDSKMVSIRGASGRANLRVTRADFEAAISPSLAQMSLLCEVALDEAGLGGEGLDAVILAGGSTRIPAVRDVAEKAFGAPLVSFGNPDEIVALGAAVYAGLRAGTGVAGEGQKEALAGLSVSEKTSMSYGTVSLGFDASESGPLLQNTVIIPRLTEIPCERTQVFYTATDGQAAVRCQVTEAGADETDLEFVKVVWVGELALGAPRPQGHPVEVAFAYDENQVMRCSFRDGEGGEPLEVDLRLTGSKSAVDSPLDIEDFKI